MNTHEAIMSRYACRKYTGEQLTEQELKALTDAANAAPVAMGDDYHYVETSIKLGCGSEEFTQKGT